MGRSVENPSNFLLAVLLLVLVPILLVGILKGVKSRPIATMGDTVAVLDHDWASLTLLSWHESDIYIEVDPISWTGLVQN